ncbi:Fad binding domain protein [Fusarium sp. LHS14.1]|nr:Fad binding domain protein [Fusarium sp. LHS14.1]
MHVLIVGAGLGGLTLAQTLRKQGISFEIFDRDKSSDGRFQGWAIALHTIVEDLLACLPDDMPDLKESTNHLAPLTLSHQFVYYYGGRQGRFGIEEGPGMTFIRAERSRLRKWLLTNVDVQWSKAAVQTEHGSNGVSVSFADGTEAKGDVLVGADGAHSIVRQLLLQRPSSELLQVVPLKAIVGEVTLAGEAFKRQLALGHSAYNLIYPELGFIAFVGLHHALPDGKSGRYYWMFMQPDPEDVSHPDHWLQTSSQQEKLEYVRKATVGLDPKLSEIFHLTPLEGVRKEPHVWRDLEIDSLPSGRVALLGDAAHAMTPSRGEGAFHAFVDALKLSVILGRLETYGNAHDINVVTPAVQEYHTEILERGGAAVRASRSSYQDAKNRAESGQHFAPGMKVIPEETIVLS